MHVSNTPDENERVVGREVAFKGKTDDDSINFFFLWDLHILTICIHYWRALGKGDIVACFARYALQSNW